MQFYLLEFDSVATSLEYDEVIINSGLEGTLGKYWCELGSVCGLNLDLRICNTSTWDQVMSSCKYIPVNYTCSSIDFQTAYLQDNINQIQDLSTIIYWDNRPVAIWPISLSSSNGKNILGSHGMPVHPPLFVNSCPLLTRKNIIKRCLKIADIFSVKFGVSSWESSDSFMDSLGLSDWHLASMNRGATCAITHDLFINLRLSMEEIKNGIRKSYKSLVSSGLRHWSLGVLEKMDNSVWGQFHDLHVNVAGRKTRSDETWDIHHRDIGEKRGFLVYLSNEQGGMEGAGFFKFTRDEGLYAVAAYRRDLFDKPLGHIVQYRAIEELKRRDVRWYKLGRRYFHSDTPKPSDKEVTIAEFKQGFSTHLFPGFKLTHVVLDDGSS